MATGLRSTRLRLSPLVDMGGAGDLVAIRGEHHSSASGEGLVVVFHVTNQSPSTLQEITLSAMLLGPVRFAFASQRQTFHVAGLRRGESREWRIPVAVGGVARSSVMLEVIVRLDEEDSAPITTRSQAYRLPICAALRRPHAAPDPSLFYALWSTLPHGCERAARIDLEADGAPAARAATDAAEALSSALRRELGALPIQHVCGDRLRDFGSFRSCFRTETSAGDAVCMIVHGVAVSTAGGVTGVVTLAMRSTSAEVVATMEAAPEYWFANLLPNTEHAVVAAGHAAASAPPSGLVEELLAIVNSAAVDASSALEDRRDGAAASQGRAVALGEFNLSVVHKWREAFAGASHLAAAV